MKTVPFASLKKAFLKAGIDKIPKAPTKPTKKNKFRTQKAQGIWYLSNDKYYNGTFISVPAFVILQSLKDFKNPVFKYKYLNGTDFNFPFFARPCPSVPRHGFVDSCLVKNKKELANLWTKSKSVDPNAELILMYPYLHTPASGVLTQTQITIGPKNDGATQGKHSFTLPIVGMSNNWFPASTGIKNSPYIEFLFSKSYNIRVVQLRDGPKQVGHTDNYIPTNTKVLSILEANGDLLEWEQKMATAKPGTVVYHPGGSYVSHFAVHAILNHVPIIFDKKPKINEILKANTVTRNNHLFLKEVVRGINYGIGPINEITDNDTNLVLFATHHALALMHNPNGALIIGLAASMLVKMGFAACLGEKRHLGEENGSRTGRNSIYKKVLSTYPAYKIRSSALDAYASFKFKYGWPGSGFGGEKWANCTKSVIKLEKKIIKFTQAPSKRRLNILILGMHGLLNSIHNNGPCLDKFNISTQRMDDFAKSKPHTIIRGALGCYLWHIQHRKYKNYNISRLRPLEKITKIPVGYRVVEDFDYTQPYQFFVDGQTRKTFRAASSSLSRKLHYKGDLLIIPPEKINKLPPKIKRWAKKSSIKLCNKFTKELNKND